MGWEHIANNFRSKNLITGQKILGLAGLAFGPVGAAATITGKAAKLALSAFLVENPDNSKTEKSSENVDVEPKSVDKKSKNAEKEEKEAFVYEASADKGWNMDKFNSYKDKFGKVAKSNGVEEYSINDLNAAIAERTGTDVVTTSNQRKTALSAKASNGMTYVQANLIMEELLDKYVKILTSSNLAAKAIYHDANAKRDDRIYIKSLALKLMQDESPDDYAKYKEAEKASMELTEKYPDILKCLVDARDELKNV